MASPRLPHARIMAVEIFRGPDHMATRMLTVRTVRRQGRVCNALSSLRQGYGLPGDNAFHRWLDGSASPARNARHSGAGGPKTNASRRRRSSELALRENAEQRSARRDL